MGPETKDATSPGDSMTATGDAAEGDAAIADASILVDSLPTRDAFDDRPAGNEDQDVGVSADAVANAGPDSLGDGFVDLPLAHDAVLTDAVLADSPPDALAKDAGNADASDAPPSCTPEDNPTFCTRLAKACGPFTAADNCGASRTVASCGTCTGNGQTCGGAGVANQCGVAPGTTLWARSMSTMFLLGVAESSTGVMVSGSLTAPADLGDPGKPVLVTPVGATDTVLAQFATNDSTYQFSGQFGASSPAGTGNVFGFLGALASGDAPMLSGVSYCSPGGTPVCNQVDVGAGLVTPGGGTGADGFVGRYALTTGKAEWVKRLYGPAESKIVAVANGPGSTLLAAGAYNGAVTLAGGSDAPVTFTSLGYRDILLAQFDSFTGALGTTVKTFGGTGDDAPSSVVWTGSGIVMAGSFNGTLTFGSTVLTSMDYDPWVAKLGADGTPIWAVRFGSATKEEGASAVVDAAGDVYATGTFAGSVAFGSFNLTSAGGLDVFVIKLRGSDGVVLWADSIGSTGDDGSSNIAINGSGQMLVAANVAGAIAGGGPGFGGQDSAFVAFNSDGTRRWTKVIGTSDTDYAWTVATGTGVFYAAANPGSDPGSTVDGVTIFGAPKAAGLLLRIQP